MFTGLVEAVGAIIEIQPDSSAVRISIESEIVFADAQVGDSIAINGCCLTMVSMATHRGVFEAGAETLSRTNLGSLQAGDPVNLERSMRAGDRLGGHFVTGHIDCVGAVRSREEDGQWSTFWFSIPPPWSHHLVAKGSIAVNGVSLTVVDVADDSFSVALIPHTLTATNLGIRSVGDLVNLETDMLAKYVEQAVRHHMASAS